MSALLRREDLGMTGWERERGHSSRPASAGTSLKDSGPESLSQLQGGGGRSSLPLSFSQLLPGGLARLTILRREIPLDLRDAAFHKMSIFHFLPLGNGVFVFQETDSWKERAGFTSKSFNKYRKVGNRGKQPG